MARILDAKAALSSSLLRPSSHIAQVTKWDPSRARGELEEGECDPHPLLFTGGNGRVATNTRNLPEDFIHNVCRTAIRVFGSETARSSGVTVDHQLPRAAFGSKTDLKLVTDPAEVTQLLRDCVFRSLMFGFGVAPVEPISMSPAGGLVVCPRVHEIPSQTPRDSAKFAAQFCQFIDRCAKNGLVCLGKKTVVEWDEKNQTILVRDMRDCYLAWSREQWNKETLQTLQTRIDPQGNKKVVEWKAKLSLQSMETPGQLAQGLIFL